MRKVRCSREGRALQRHPGCRQSCMSPSWGIPIERCLPPIAPSRLNRALHVRAALASTLVAGLELARNGSLKLSQHEAFETVSFSPSVNLPG